MMKKAWGAAALVALMAGCAQHDAGYDEAMAACDTEALEQAETAVVPSDQRAAWRENYVRECMQRKGFEE
jgi:hypothetical protein